MKEFKIVRDPIHGDIKFEGIFLEFLESPEIQRLHSIRQLGFAHMVFPGANHTRLEHSIGTFKMAEMAGEILSLKEEERLILSSAAMLHDVGHGPFSHTLESILRERFKVDHVDLTEKILLGKEEIFEEDEKKYVNAPSVVEVIEKHGLNPMEIVKIIRGKHEKRYLSQLLNSPIDVDQLDYLVRDGYYTGVAYGHIDVERFLNMLRVVNGDLAISRKGVSVVENILMARCLMFSSVYFHKTVRIAELMISKAIELANEEHPFKFYKCTDDEILSILRNSGGFQKEIAIRLKYRRLFKQAYSLPASYEEGNIGRLEDPAYRSKKEREFEEVLGIPEGYVIIDVPKRELFLSEPRIDKVSIPVLDTKGVERMENISPVVNAIKSRRIPEWSVMIVTDEPYRKKVSENAESILFD